MALSVALRQMLNRCLAIVLLVALVSSNFSRFFIYAGFEVNQKYIASTLCENKARPWMNCNGRCYLMKKIKQAEEKEKKQERDDKRNQYQEALPAAPTLALTIKRPAQRKSFPRLPAPGIIDRATPIFQPPKIA
jgi:hypothetical protein